MKYTSQCKQDYFLNEVIFKGKKDGIFVDVGANDGVTYSNSYFFEKELGWTGICIEPLPGAFAKLKKNRNCNSINGCCSNNNSVEIFLNVDGYGEMLSGLKSKYDPRHLNRLMNEVSLHGGSISEIEVICYNMNDLLLNNRLLQIDFISLDTEGGELDILKTLDFDNIGIKVIVVENAYNEPYISEFMKKKGFSMVKKLDADEVFVNKKEFNFLTRLKFKNSKMK